MRVIGAFDRAVRAVAMSADGRFLAATSDGHSLILQDWVGSELWRTRCQSDSQLSFSPDGFWLASCSTTDLQIWGTDGRPALRPPVSPGLPFAGGVAFAPNGKHLVASRNGSLSPPAISSASLGQLTRWTVPTWQPAPGFDPWPAFPHLTFSADGQFVAGINPLVCEFRFAVSGGLQCRVRMRGRGVHTFVSFAPDSRAAICGWDAELHVIEPVGGKAIRLLHSPDLPFRDAAFTGTGRHVGTVDHTGMLRLWDATTWEVARTYDWGVGPLTCVAFTADGLAGACGTENGQIVLFDLD